MEGGIKEYCRCHRKEFETREGLLEHELAVLEEKERENEKGLEEINKHLYEIHGIMRQEEERIEEEEERWKEQARELWEQRAEIDRIMEEVLDEEWLIITEARAEHRETPAGIPVVRGG